MALGKLSEFASMVSAGGVSRQNQYEFRFYAPSGVSYKGGSQTEFFMRCESVSFPGLNLSTTVDDIRTGPSRDHVIGVTYGNITATFLCDDSLAEKKFWHDWQALMYDKDSWQIGYYNDYVSDMYIGQLGAEGRETYSAKLIDAFPTAVTALDLSASSTEFHKLSVEISFHKWEEPEDLPSL